MAEIIVREEPTTLVEVSDGDQLVVVEQPIILHAQPVVETIVEAQRFIDVITLGTQGPPGASSTATFVHDQMTPASLWTVVHELNKYPSVTIVDSAGTVVYGDVQYLDTRSLTVSFSAAFAGSAYLN